jgi:tRNA pseudouridine55 synthase
MELVTPLVPEGILLLDKSKGRTSFSLVHLLRKQLKVKKIGHAGTLDPFATGVMVMLIGRNYTRLSDSFLTCEKEYIAEILLGITTDTFDCEGKIIAQSPLIPSLQEIEQTLFFFQGEIEQMPPMYSAKKKDGKKFYEYARQGIEIERAPVKVNLETTLLDYQYPYLKVHVSCSKGTYIRSIGYDLGLKLGCGAHLTNLQRIRSGKFHLKDCIKEEKVPTLGFSLPFLNK